MNEEKSRMLYVATFTIYMMLVLMGLLGMISNIGIVPLINHIGAFLIISGLILFWIVEYKKRWFWKLLKTL